MAALSRPKVTVLGADSPIGLTVVRELGAHGLHVIAHGRSDRALGRFSRFAAESLVDPRPLAAWLPAYCRAKGLAAVLAISEGQLIELAALRPALGETRVIGPDAMQLAQVLNKARTLEVARGLGIDVPAAWQPQAGDDFGAEAAKIAYPVAVKWADPNAAAPLLAEHGLGFEKVEYAGAAEALLAILSRYDGLGCWPLVQQYCPGVGLGQMLHIHEGRASLRFQHRRLREFPPSGGVSSFCTAVPLSEHAAQMAQSEALLHALGWEGPAMVEYRHDAETGRYWLMEVNGRFWGSIPLAWHCGAHFARETWACAMEGGNTAGQGPLRMRRARYLIPDAKALVLALCDPHLPVLQRIAAILRFFVDFLDPRVRYYVWSVRDPGPLLGDLAGIIRRLWRRDRP